MMFRASSIIREGRMLWQELELFNEFIFSLRVRRVTGSNCSKTVEHSEFRFWFAADRFVALSAEILSVK